ncbi:uncharacterized protein PF11_0207-like [Xenia sp. Carnegie-2017]|uniref:uncharacterized protein PF11_0207-like n=1 Tax=Xenia sp. Carnegie-2017 TaxID=2897299 RepID=UPI001F04BAA6|nr:uncharacterized protein PF11_0207-like [Xenia sp. Carnegie-2017]
MNNSSGKLKFSQGNVENLEEEISSLAKHRSTLKETSPEEDFAQAKLEDIKQKANKLEQENSRLRDDVQKIGVAIAKKEEELSKIKLMLADNKELPCPKCKNDTGASRSKPGDKDEKNEISEMNFEKNESLLTSDTVESSTSMDNIVSSTDIGPNPAHVSRKSTLTDEFTKNNSQSSDSENDLPYSNEEIDNTEQKGTTSIELTHTPKDNVDFEAETAFLNTPPSTNSKQKRKKQKKKDKSQTAISLSNGKKRFHATDKNTNNEYVEDSAAGNKTVLKMKNKAVQTIHGHLSPAFNKKSSPRDILESTTISRAETEEAEIDYVKGEIPSFAGEKTELDSGWKTKLHKLSENIEDILVESDGASESKSAEMEDVKMNYTCFSPIKGDANQVHTYTSLNLL